MNASGNDVSTGYEFWGDNGIFKLLIIHLLTEICSQYFSQPHTNVAAVAFVLYFKPDLRQVLLICLQQCVFGVCVCVEKHRQDTEKKNSLVFILLGRELNLPCEIHHQESPPLPWIVHFMVM